MIDLREFECAAFLEGEHVAVRLTVNSLDEWESRMRVPSKDLGYRLGLAK